MFVCVFYYFLPVSWIKNFIKHVLYFFFTTNVDNKPQSEDKIEFVCVFEKICSQFSTWD